MMQRAIAAAILANGKSVLNNYTPCGDTDSALQIARDLGCRIQIDGKRILITGSYSKLSADDQPGFNTEKTIINCGESGLAMRMFTPVAALDHRWITLSGKGSLLKRPVSMLESPLKELGANIETNNGFVPVKVKGPLKGGYATVDGSISSQLLTGLLIALPCTDEDSILLVDNLTSKPYIEMTLQVMKAFGVEASHSDYKTFSIKGKQEYHPVEYDVEGDWSGAAFLLVAGALRGSVIVENLSTDSLQADTKILKALDLAGARVTSSGNSVYVEKSSLNAFEFDATDCPDLFPPLVALASHCKGRSFLKGVGRLQHKESNRAIVLKDEFAKLGTEIKLQDDLMIIEGGLLKGGKVHSNNDHRIAMSTAVAATAATDPVIIENSESVAKSYPGFYEDLKTIGVHIE